jgi:hypothetical protein
MPKSSGAMSVSNPFAQLPLSPFPLMSLFLNGYTMMLEMQRQASTPLPLRGRAADSNHHVEIGEAEHVIPVPREELQVGKRQVVSTKALRVRTIVTEVPVEQHVDLRTEKVMIERRPSTSPPNGDAFQERIIEVQEMHEEPVVTKVIRQGDEVVISKAVGEHRATIREIVRETHVEVEGEVEDNPPKRERQARQIALVEAPADKPEQDESEEDEAKEDEAKEDEPKQKLAARKGGLRSRSRPR